MRYSKDEKKEDSGEDGKLKEASRQCALSYLLQQCTEFKDEKSDLEHLAIELSRCDTTIYRRSIDPTQGCTYVFW
jgi:hypothetical protein